MGFRRRIKILKSGKSPSTEAMKRLYKRTILNGGVNAEFTSSVEGIRDLSRRLGRDILKEATLVYIPGSYGEGKTFTQQPYLKNLFTRSGEFNSSPWSKGASSINPDVVVSPKGDLSADLFLEDTTNNRHRIQSGSIYLKGGQQYNLSIYVNKASHDWIQLNSITSSNLEDWANFNVSTGVVGNTGLGGAGANISNEGGGWYRCSIVLNPLVDETIFLGTVVATNNTNSGRYPSYLGTGASCVYIYGAQLTLGADLKPYEHTTDGIIDSQHTRATTSTVTQKDGSIGDSCYNQIQRSEEIDNASWGKTLSSITANAMLAPNGTLTADLVSSTASTNTFYQISNTSLSRVDSTTYNVSFHFRNNGLTSSETIELSCVITQGSNEIRARFNPVTLSFLSSNVTGSFSGLTRLLVEPLLDSWYRISYGFTISGTTIFSVRGTVSGVSNLNPCYIWGGQLTRGLELKPYLRTTDRLNFPKTDYSYVTNNLVKWSEDYTNPVWNNGGATITSNVIANPVDGAVTADLWDDTNASNNPSIVGQTNIIATSTSVTYSIYTKAGTATNRNFLLRNQTTSTAFNQVTLSYATGNLSNQPTGWTKETLSNGWFRLIYTQTTGIRVGDILRIYTGRGATGAAVGATDTWYLYGAQVEHGITVTDYAKTTSVPVAWGKKAMNLFEPARTNLVLWSEDFTQSVTTTDLTGVINTTLNPFNINKSYYITEGTASSSHNLTKATVSVTSGTIYTTSWYVKKADDTWVQFVNSSAGFGTTVWTNFNFDTGLFGNRGIDGIWEAKQLINEYWLITVRMSAISTASTNICGVSGTNNTNTSTRLLSYTGTSRKACDLAAVQFESTTSSNYVGVSTYIPTTTAAVTRNADTELIPNIPQYIGQTKGSIYIEGSFFSRGEFLRIDDGTGTNRIYVFCIAAKNSGAGADYAIQAASVINGVTVPSATAISNNQLVAYKKIMIVYDTSSSYFKVFINGVLSVTLTTSGNFTQQLKRLQIGSITEQSASLIRTLILSDKTFSDSEAIALTAGGEQNLVADAPSFPISSSLAAYYDLNSNTTNQGDITTPNGAANSIDYVTGKTGNAARFDSATDYIDIADTDNLSFTNGTSDLPFSISMWVYVTAFNSSGNILAYKSDGTLYEWSLSIQNNAVRFSKYNSDGGAGQGVGSPINGLVVNTWYLITVTDNGSKTESGMNIYIGQTLQTKTSISSGTYTGMTNTNTIVRLGQLPWTTASSYNHLGYMEDAGFWKNRVLTQQDINYLNNSGSGRTYPF